MNSFAFTCGDINGIGPEITIKALNKIVKKYPLDRFYFICPKKVFLTTSLKTRPSFKFDIISTIKNQGDKRVHVLSKDSFSPEFGKPTPKSGKASYNSLQNAFTLWQNGFADAIITSPVSKTALKMAGINFPGQTEMFAKWLDSKNYVMMFLSRKIISVPATIHIPLKDVAKSLKINKLIDLLNVIYKTLIDDLKCLNPKIAVLGLNPHAGENGYIGNEENKIIIPAIQKFRKKTNSLIEGVFPADGFWGNKIYKNYDAVVAMYHDQALIPFKLLNFGKGVNFTAGLSLVRTSPDHGVAYDIAGENIADESSMIEAFEFARKISLNRKK